MRASKAKCDPARIFTRIVVSDRGCWLYTGGIQKGGYGIVSIDNKSVQTHRVAYELRVGPIPSGMCVLHTCDTRRCINPAHLFLGTLGENNADRLKKGRNADRRGEKNPQAKLDTARAERVRRAYLSGKFSQADVGEIFGISQQQVSCIVRREAWSGKRGRRARKDL